jgi:hypothetical protein
MGATAICDELGLSMLFDGELKGKRALSVGLHLLSCRECRDTWRFYTWLEEAARRWRLRQLAAARL